MSVSHDIGREGRAVGFPRRDRALAPMPSSSWRYSVGAMSVEPKQSSAPSRLAILWDVLCGVDGTHSAYEAVRQAASLAGPGGQLTLVAVTAVAASGQQRTASMAPARARRALLHARRIAADAGVPASVEVDMRGPVAAVLLERAHGHGVLAIGEPSMGRLGAWVSNS